MLYTNNASPLNALVTQPPRLDVGNRPPRLEENPFQGLDVTPDYLALLMGMMNPTTPPPAPPVAPDVVDPTQKRPSAFFPRGPASWEARPAPSEQSSAPSWLDKMFMNRTPASSRAPSELMARIAQNRVNSAAGITPDLSAARQPKGDPEAGMNGGGGGPGRGVWGSNPSLGGLSQIMQARRTK
jgi:hypothetical protein